MVLEDFEFCGIPARRGQEIIFMLGAANRDGNQFKDPDRLDLKRAKTPTSRLVPVPISALEISSLGLRVRWPS